MTEKQGKNKVCLPERRREVGDLPPGVGTSDVPWEAGRAAGRKGHPGCQPCFLHPGPPQDSLHTHTQPRRPQTSISSLILQPPTEIPLAQRIAKRGCFAQAPFFPRGWPSCLLPLFWKFSYMIALLFLIGVFPECSGNILQAWSASQPKLRLTNSSSPRSVRHGVQDGAAHPTSLPTRARLKLACGEAGASIAQDTIVNHNC